MKSLFAVLCAVLSFGTPAFATVAVSSPTNNSTVSSPVHYVASATTSTCSKGVASMGIYVDDKLDYVVDATSMNTTLAVSAGKHNTVVEEWDHCGGASYTSLTITVSSGSTPTGVTVTSPVNNSTVTSPVHYVASATTGTCSSGVASMGIYVDDKLDYVVDATSMNTNLAVATGTHNTVVEEWDHCGGASYTSLTITVAAANPAPTVSITAKPSSIAPGSSSVLDVTASNATGVTVTGSDGSSYTLTATGGMQSVDPSKTTTYTATATGSGGTAAASTTVTVTTNPPPTVNISASPTSITSGNSSTLAITASNATQIVLTGTDGTNETLESPSSDTLSVDPTSTTTYTATASGPGGSMAATTTVTVTNNPAPTVKITANPTTISSGNSSTLTVTATNATAVTITGSDGSSYSLADTGGTQSVSPTSTTTYTAKATGNGSSVTAATTVTVESTAGVNSIDHVIFMLQENHSFDNYLGMLNPYRVSNGWNIGDDGNTYTIDGIDDKLSTISNTDDEGTKYSLFKLKSTCIDDASSDWLASYGDVNTYNFLETRPILMDGFVHNAEGYAKSCVSSKSCSGAYTDTTGQRAMGYYDQGFLNYYYYMASQFAVSDRWFSPVASKTVDNRIATFTGGTTQGLVKDPQNDDHLPQLNIETIFQELDNAKVSWKIYYSSTQGYCLSEDDCGTSGNDRYPATNFSTLSYSHQYLHTGTCSAPTVSSTAVGDSTGSFCIDPSHIAPLSDPNYGYFADLTNGTLPSFAFIEPGYGINDEHPDSGQPVINGQAAVAKVINALMSSSEWNDSVFFLGYDEGGGPYDHVPPVPGHTDDFTNTQGQTYPDISSIAVDPDSYNPCLPPSGTPTTHCDLTSSLPGAHSGDAAAEKGFAAQLGFRIPNMVVSPFARRHYVSHIPMDHTAIIKFVENRFIGSSAHLTSRDAAQPNLLDFFDFTGIPWATPPAPPSPVTTSACTPASMGP